MFAHRRKLCLFFGMLTWRQPSFFCGLWFPWIFGQFDRPARCHCSRSNQSRCSSTVTSYFYSQYQMLIKRCPVWSLQNSLLLFISTPNTRATWSFGRVLCSVCLELTNVVYRSVKLVHCFHACLFWRFKLHYTQTPAGPTTSTHSA